MRIAAVVVASLAGVVPLAAQGAACADRPEYHLLEFWIGTWDVFVGAPGAVKEKAAVPGAPAGSVRFQGEVVTASGARVLDRTTLTPLDGGAVRQLIEVSSDGGAPWRPTFDAVYRPRR